MGHEELHGRVQRRMATGGLASLRSCRAPTRKVAPFEEARENLKEATRLIIEANRDLARHESEGTSVIREPLVLAGE
jgi:hypothetical protein